MGYCYQGRKLCCDICGTPGARKYRCPFGYCQAIAACPKCKVERKQEFTKDGHRKHGCEKNHLAFQAREALEASIIALGGAVLRSAMFMHNCNHYCQVIFETSNGQVSVYMPSNIYEKREDVATLKFFEQLNGGRAFPKAPIEFYGPGGSLDKTFDLNYDALVNEAKSGK